MTQKKIRKEQQRIQKIGKAYEKFLQLIERQSGDISYLNNIPKAKYIKEVVSDKVGYVASLDAEICRKGFTRAWCTVEKQKKMIQITQHGIVLEKKIGDKVEKGEVLAYIHTNMEEKIEEANIRLKEAFEISGDKPERYEGILDVI